MATRAPRRQDGTQPWIAHWREDNGRQRAKTFSTKANALAYEQKMRLEKEARILGERTMARETTLADWIREWWSRDMASATQATRENYERVINKYLGPELGPLTMEEMRPARIASYRDQLLARGEAPSSVAYSMTVLSSSLKKAVERGYFDGNPCANLSKPKQLGIRKLKWPPSPREVEALRIEFLNYRAVNSGPWIALRSATLVAIMAYAGLRPSEAMGMKVGAFDRTSRALIVEDVYAADHRVGDTKTHYHRVVELVDPLVEDLEMWLEVGLEGKAQASDWMFPPAPGVGVTRWVHANWAARPWSRARDAVVTAHPTYERTLGQATPKDLRAGFVSLLGRAGHSAADIADLSGHSIKVMNRHYMGSLRMLRRMPVIGETEQIELARREHGSIECVAHVHSEMERLPSPMPIERPLVDL